LFAKVNLAEDEYKLYETVFDIIYPNLPEPDLIIYLHAPLSKLKQNIKTRNRDYEQHMEDDYLNDLQQAYLQLIKSNKFRTLIVDTTQTDFLHQEHHLNQLLSYLEQDFSYGHHFLDIV
jgi:deoxyadenosine/deoxycytidine kinase